MKYKDINAQIDAATQLNRKVVHLIPSVVAIIKTVQNSSQNLRLNVLKYSQKISPNQRIKQP